MLLLVMPAEAGIQGRFIKCKISTSKGIAQQVRFAFSLGANFFMEIAKLRAARLVWAQIIEVLGGDAEA